MKTYTLFDPTGRMVQTITGEYDLTIKPTLAAWGGEHAEGEFGGDHYYVRGRVEPRPQQPVELHKNTLRGLLPPCVIEINTQQYECMSTQATLNFNQPAIYNIRVVKWPYMDKEFTIDYQP